MVTFNAAESDDRKPAPLSSVPASETDTLDREERSTWRTLNESVCNSIVLGGSLAPLVPDSGHVYYAE